MVEVLVSMLLFSVGVLGLVRALGISVRDAGDIQYRATAISLADQTIGRMWVDRGNLAGYVVTDANVPQLPGGRQTVAVNGQVVQVTLRWLPPGAANDRVHTVSATLAGN
jgi:type IV pilus assembly protein PilV